MAIEKPLNPMPSGEESEEVQIEVVNPEAVSVTTEDSAMLIDFTGEVADEVADDDGEDAMVAGENE